MSIASESAGTNHARGAVSAFLAERSLQSASETTGHDGRHLPTPNDGRTRPLFDPSAPMPRLLFVGVYVPSALGSHAISEDLAERLTNIGWTILLTSRTKGRLQRVIDILATIWRTRNGYDIAHVDVYSGAAFRWAELACRLLGWLGKPYILTLHGGNLPELIQRSPARVRKLLSSAAAVTAPSQYLVDAASSIRADVFLLPNPIDLAHYHYRLRRSPSARMVWLRAFHEIYNPSMAVRTLAHLSADHADAALSMVGPDKDGSLTVVRALAEATGIDLRLVVCGGVPKHAVPSYLDAADIFLNTTKVDNSPVSVLEAMASGLCIVSTSVGGIPYLLEHDVDGLLVPSGDDTGMATAVHRILSEPGLAERLSTNARRKAERYTWSQVLPRWLELFAAVIEHREARSA